MDAVAFEIIYIYDSLLRNNIIFESMQSLNDLGWQKEFWKKILRNGPSQEIQGTAFQQSILKK